MRGDWWAGTGCRFRPAGAAACTAARLTAAQSHSLPAAVTTSTTTGGVRPAYSGVRPAYCRVNNAHCLSTMKHHQIVKYLSVKAATFSKQTMYISSC